MTVSYVVTVFRKAAYLPLVLPAIDAERADTGGNIFVVFRDDGPDDPSAAILAAFATDRPEILVIRQHNRGVAEATNIGLGSASQPFIRLIDADDILIAGSTRRLRQVMETSGADLVYGAKTLYRLGEPLPVEPGREDRWREISKPLRAVLQNCDIVPSASLLRGDAVKAVLPLVEGVRTAQDFMLAARLSQRGKVVYLDGSAVCHFAADIDETRLSHSVAGMYADTCRLIAAHMEGRFALPNADLRFATRRNAGRAARFAKRELKLSFRQSSLLQLLKLRSSLPFYTPRKSDLDFLVSVYGA